MKWVVPIVLAVVLMLIVRSLVVSVHSIEGTALAPLFSPGDRVIVNRCSYGMRIGGSRLLPYSRLMRRSIERGDIVAFVSPQDSVEGLLIARCTAVPGDTLHTSHGTLIVPGRKQCAAADYYWMEPINSGNPADSRRLGLISEQDVVGRVEKVLYKWPLP